VAQPVEKKKAQNLFPGVIEHYGTTNRNSRFVLHECVEGLFVIVAPLMKKWTSVKQHGREFLEWQ